MTVLVSVIIPAYNAERTIKNAVESVLEQSLRELEVLICDDASTDNTGNIIRSFNDERIKFVSNSKNLGVAKSRDNLIRLAQGRWLAVMDADDFMHKERLRQLVGIAEKNPDAMVIDDLLECHDTDHGMLPWKRLRGPKAFHCDGYHSIAVSIDDYIKQERLLIKPLIPMKWIQDTGAHHGITRFGEDTRFFLHLIARGLGIRYFPHAMYFYRITRGSLTAYRDRDIQMLRVLKDVQPLFSNAAGILAIQFKIEQIERSIKYSELLALLRHSKVIVWMKIVFANPWFFGMFIRRLMQDMRVKMHGVFYGAFGRGSQ